MHRPVPDWVAALGDHALPELPGNPSSGVKARDFSTYELDRWIIQGSLFFLRGLEECRFRYRGHLTRRFRGKRGASSIVGATSTSQSTEGP